MLNLIVMLNIILTESALERVPKPLWHYSSVAERAKRLNKQPGQMLLDRSFHHGAMLNLRNGEKRGRPDIVHFCLLEALGTPLNKENLLKICVHTFDDYIIYLNPKVRLPRNYDRFVGLIEQMYKLDKIAKENVTLLELKKGSLSNLVGEMKPSYIIALSRIGKPRLLREVTRILVKKESPLVLIGAFPKGNFSGETRKISNELISIDPEMLEAWIVISRLIYEYERAIKLPEKRIKLSVL